MERCNRCRKETSITIMSMFNTDILCDDCKKEEEQHPDYEMARKAERDACMRGDYNFRGIGWPR